jgi:hypothetical protein
MCFDLIPQKQIGCNEWLSRRGWRACTCPAHEPVRIEILFHRGELKPTWMRKQETTKGGSFLTEKVPNGQILNNDQTGLNCFLFREPAGDAAGLTSHDRGLKSPKSSLLSKSSACDLSLLCFLSGTEEIPGFHSDANQ